MSERKMYVAIKAQDNVGNVSAMSSVLATVPAGQQYFMDTADDASQWQATGSWGRMAVAGDAHGYVWTDSPYGNYGDDQDTGITSNPISLAGIQEGILMFDVRHSLEDGYDALHLEVTELDADGNETSWYNLGSFTGNQDWKQVGADLAEYADKTVKIRFRLISDSSNVEDGVHIDNVAILGA